MTDWNNPSTSQPHSQELQSTKERDEANARMDYSGESNIPDGTIRWSAANERFEIWDAANTAWNELSPKYLINVDKLDGRDAGNASGDIPVSNGTTNSNLRAASAVNADTVDGQHASEFLGVSAKAADSDKLDGANGASYLKKSEFDPANATLVWSGDSDTVDMSSLSDQGPGLYSLEVGTSTSDRVWLSLYLPETPTEDVGSTAAFSGVSKLFARRALYQASNQRFTATESSSTGDITTLSIFKVKKA